VDRLAKDLKTLAKQTKNTKYSDVMKLLRLALSGLQVPEDDAFPFIDRQKHDGFKFCHQGVVSYSLNVSFLPLASKSVVHS